MEEVFKIKQIIEKQINNSLYTKEDIDTFLDIFTIVLQGIDNIDMIKNFTSSQIKFLVKKHGIKKINHHLYLKETEYNEIINILNKIIIKIKRVSYIFNEQVNYYNLLEKVNNNFLDFNEDDYYLLYKLIMQSDKSDEDKTILLFYLSKVIKKDINIKM